MNNILIAIVTCHAYRERAEAQRTTWAQKIEGADIRFFLGAGGEARHEDEIILPALDDYKALPTKTQAMRQWAHAAGYAHVWKLDDDVYARAERLLSSGFQRHHYMGRLRGPSGEYRAPYASGFCYSLSRRAIEALLAAPPSEDWAEDRHVGNILLAAGIQCAPEYRIVVVTSTRNATSHHEGPRKGNGIIAACEYETAAEMARAHHEFENVPSVTNKWSMPDGELSDVCVIIKTFLRDGYLFHAIKGVQTNLPEVKMIIVDDGAESKQKINAYAWLREHGHVCEWLPFDSGFGAKANRAAVLCDRPYVLIGADDFMFTKEAREGIIKLKQVLDSDPFVGVASGRVNNRPYESCFEIEGRTVLERPGYREIRRTSSGLEYRICDLTVNYSLIRCSVLEQVHWDADVKIGGGEHGSFYLDVKRAGWDVAYVPGVIINELPFDSSRMDLRYPALRDRAKQPGRPCLIRRGIERWIRMDGTVEDCQ